MFGVIYKHVQVLFLLQKESYDIIGFKLSCTKHYTLDVGALHPMLLLITVAAIFKYHFFCTCT